MEKYYLLSWKETNKPVASAFAPKGAKLAQDLISELDQVTKLPFELNLVKLSVEKNGLSESDDLSGVDDVWLDYQPNSLAWPLMSEKLKSVIAENLIGNEEIDWVTCTVKNKFEVKEYFILRFNKITDVLDMQKTMFVRGTDVIIKPAFSKNKIEKYSVFTATTAGYGDLWRITSALYVSEVVKKAIQKHKLTGLDFERILIA